MKYKILKLLLETLKPQKWGFNVSFGDAVRGRFLFSSTFEYILVLYLLT